VTLFHLAAIRTSEPSRCPRRTPNAVSAHACTQRRISLSPSRTPGEPLAACGTRTSFLEPSSGPTWMNRGRASESLSPSCATSLPDANYVTSVCGARGRGCPQDCTSGLTAAIEACQRRSGRQCRARRRLSTVCLSCLQCDPFADTAQPGRRPGRRDLVNCS
jgi:hypothetical protein